MRDVDNILQDMKSSTLQRRTLRLTAVRTLARFVLMLLPSVARQPDILRPAGRCLRRARLSTRI